MNLPTDGNSPESDHPSAGTTRTPHRLGDLHKTITMAQIAKAAGVSQGAISSLLNDRDYGIRVSERTRERVFKVCREMGYLPNDLRAVVRMYPELGGFALLISTRYSGGLEHALVSRSAAAAMQAIPEASRSLALAFYDEAKDYGACPEGMPEPIAAGTVSKFLFLGAPNLSLVQMITRRGCPVVVLGYDAPIPGVHSILSDLLSAPRHALEHLVGCGHRRLAIVSGPFGSNEPEILEMNHGIRLACEQLSIPVDARNILYGDLSANAGRVALDSLLERDPVPTAIFCLSDAAAAGVIAQAAVRGIRVPTQLSVIGCADDPCADMATPGLTTVRLPYEEMASLGVREVDQLVRGGGLVEPRRSVLPVRLIARGSCAPQAAVEPR